jgi:hypothetical protein
MDQAEIGRCRASGEAGFQEGVAKEGIFGYIF